NRDGKLDLALATTTGATVMLGNGDGTFQNSVTYVAKGGSGLITTGDPNADGITDLLVTGSSAFVTAFLGNGDGTFRSPITSQSAPQATGISSGDINNDGESDFVAVERNANSSLPDTITVQVSKGDGRFDTITSYNATFLATGVTSGDFNEDNTLDFAV